MKKTSKSAKSVNFIKILKFVSQYEYCPLLSQ